jgi:hypothetical protein
VPLGPRLASRNRRFAIQFAMPELWLTTDSLTPPSFVFRFHFMKAELMYRWMSHASYGLMFAASLTLGEIGCSKTDPASAASQPAPAADAQHDHTDHAAHEEDGAADEVAEAFASLSPEDLAAAEKNGSAPLPVNRSVRWAHRSR